MSLPDEDMRPVLLLLKRMYGLPGMRQCCLWVKEQWQEEAVQQLGWGVAAEESMAIRGSLMEGFLDGGVP